MDTITSVAKMAYHNNVQISGEANDNVLVSRNYVTKDLFGVDSWSPSDRYERGAWVQYKGVIYRSIIDYPDGSPGENEGEWVEASLTSKLGGEVGGGLTKTKGYSLVEERTAIIQHNLNSKSLIVQLYRKENDGKLTPVENPPYTVVDLNTISLTFESDPDPSYHLVIMAFDDPTSN